jgi:uncharacterized membrane protein
MSFLSTFNLSVLGAFHTAIGLFAVALGVVAFAKHGAIGPKTSAGRIYLWSTLITVITGFFIFRHGGFGNPHVLGVVTLIVLAAAYASGKTTAFGKFSPYIETVAYSMSFFFHFIPGTAESLTRLPLGAPLASSPEAPIVQAIVGVFFVIFLIGAAYQVVKMRAARKPFAPPHPSVA